MNVSEDLHRHYAPPTAMLRDPSRPAAPPGVGRRIVAVLVGAIGVDLILGLSVTTIGTLTLVFFLGTEDALSSTPFLLGSSVLGLTFSLLGGYTAAYIAPWRPALMGGLAGATSALLSAPLLFLPDIEWGAIEIGAMWLQLPLAVFGGHLARNARS